MPNLLWSYGIKDFYTWFHAYLVLPFYYYIKRFYDEMKGDFISLQERN